ncbi:MAG: hypothetical protein ACRDRR_16450 [Pseudonocardiaceae bacterium]
MKPALVPTDRDGACPGCGVTTGVKRRGTAATADRDGRPSRPGRPVSRFGLFAMSPVDSCVHLLTPEGDQCPDALTARCGLLLTTVTTCHDQPPPGPPCEQCRLIFLAEASAPGRFAQRDE